MIDMHAHWKPAEVADALRARTREPRIVRNEDGVEVLKTRGWARSRSPRRSMTSISISAAWTARGSRSACCRSSVRSAGSSPSRWRCPGRCAGASTTGFRRSAQEHPGRFAAFAALPLTDMSAAAAELERALALPGMIGAQVPGNFFLTREDAEAMRPLLEVANRHHAVLFIHHGPRPGDAFPKVARRHG